MLTIVKDNQVLTVTKGAYNSMYAPQGWEIANGEISAKKDDFRTIPEIKEITLSEPEGQNFAENIQQNEDIPDEPEDDEVDLSEIPLSEMSVPQLKMYANQLGVTVNTDSARQLRNQIKKVLEG